MVDKFIVSELWYHGLLPREDIKAMLHKNGDFLVRSTEPVKGQPRQYVLSACTSDGKEEDIKHFVLREGNGKIFIEKQGFESITKLVEHHMITGEPIHKTVRLKTAILRQEWEQAHQDVCLTKKLGEGAFGEVWKGTLKTKTGLVDVAIKAAKLESLNKEQVKEIMREARLMRNLDHPNVVKFYGVAAGQEPLYVMMELCDGGALDSALSKNSFKMEKKMEMIWQAGMGLAYIHEKNLLHRDIAARNCLYGKGQVKISDFGLSREGQTYTMDLHKKVPIRWLAPETIKTGLYNRKTDVFAYGIMAWEITENGKEPYPGMMVAEVVGKVNSGYRMSFAPEVKKEFADIILKHCWPENADQRWLMPELVKWIAKNFQFKDKQPPSSPAGRTDSSIGRRSKEERSKMGPQNSRAQKIFPKEGLFKSLFKKRDANKISSMEEVSTAPPAK